MRGEEQPGKNVKEGEGCGAMFYRARATQWLSTQALSSNVAQPGRIDSWSGLRLYRFIFFLFIAIFLRFRISSIMCTLAPREASHRNFMLWPACSYLYLLASSFCPLQGL